MSFKSVERIVLENARARHDRDRSRGRLAYLIRSVIEFANHDNTCRRHRYHRKTVLISFSTKSSIFNYL